MTASPDFLDFLKDQLRRFGPFQVRRMFGGAGLFRDGAMFGIVMDDALFLKVDDATRHAFVARGSAAFHYTRKSGAEPNLGYFSVPPDILEEEDALCAWCRDAAAAALRAAAAKSRKPAPLAKPRRRSKTRAQ
jgi:DNA transformation protein